MRVISRRILRERYEDYHGSDRPAFEAAVKAWFREARAAGWANANQIKEKYRNASILKNGRVVFNICGNKFRIIVRINYPSQIVYIRWVGTHREYDSINAEEV